MICTWQIKHIAQKIRRGAVIAYPTEAVWGLGCDPFNATAVARLLALKDRPQHKGLILVAATIEQFAWLLEGLNTQQMEQLVLILGWCLIIIACLSGLAAHMTVWRFASARIRWWRNSVL